VAEKSIYDKEIENESWIAWIRRCLGLRDPYDYNPGYEWVRKQ
jgi:hypothetical protein